MLSECIYTSGGGGGAKVITKTISAWNKGDTLDINYVQDGLSKVDFMMAYGSRAVNGTTFPFLSVWASNMNSNGSSVQHYYNSGNADIWATQNGNTSNVGSTTQSATMGIGIVSDSAGVLRLVNLASYSASIQNVTLIVGEFITE